jgi:hypothetical protein
MALDYTHKLSSDVGEKLISKIKMIVMMELGWAPHNLRDVSR